MPPIPSAVLPSTPAPAAQPRLCFPRCRGDGISEECQCQDRGCHTTEKLPRPGLGFHFHPRHLLMVVTDLSSKLTEPLSLSKPP